MYKWWLYLFSLNSTQSKGTYSTAATCVQVQCIECLKIEHQRKEMRRRKGHYSTRVLLHFKTLNRKSWEENFSFVLQISAHENFWYIVLSFYFMLAVNGVMYNMLIWILSMWHCVLLIESTFYGITRLFFYISISISDSCSVFVWWMHTPWNMGDNSTTERLHS